MSVTDAGRQLAARLPWEHAHGRVAQTVHARWADIDALVLFLATGAATRIVAPLLRDKRADPAVVCVDEAARFAVALTGGHEGGANLLAHRVAAILGAEPVVTTASDSTGTGLIAGVGCSSDAPLDALFSLLADALDGRVPDAVATIDRRAEVVAPLGLPVLSTEVASGARFLLGLAHGEANSSWNEAVRAMIVHLAPSSAARISRVAS